MKRIIVFVAIIVLLAGSAGLYAQDDQSHKFTNGLLNGRYLVEISEPEADSFVQGVIDGVGRMAPGMLSRTYPGMDRGGVVAAVKAYYSNNPGKLHRPVAEVLLAGCK